MKRLAELFRSAQFYAHMAHNTASGSTFFSDHDYFGELYSAYEGAYDDVIERMIGLGDKVDIPAINIAAASDLKGHANHNTEQCFSYLLLMEREICDEISSLVKDASDGTQNMLQDMADKSEMRQYKLGQRLKK